jgi:hypothetical protein
MTEQEIADICSQLAEGKSLRAICREMGKAESSVRYWLHKDERAFAHSARARELGCDALADECLEIADKPSVDPVAAADKRIRIDTRLRLIGKWSQRYSDKVTVKSESTVTHKHDLSNLSTAELEQLESILAKSERSAGSAGEAVAPSLH